MRCKDRSIPLDVDQYSGYAYDPADGMYLLDLRNHSIICEPCGGGLEAIRRHRIQSDLRLNMAVDLLVDYALPVWDQKAGCWVPATDESMGKRRVDLMVEKNTAKLDYVQEVPVDELEKATFSQLMGWVEGRAVQFKATLLKFCMENTPATRERWGHIYDELFPVESESEEC